MPEPGGAIDHAAAKHQGWLVIEAEQDPAKAHPLTYASKGRDYLSRTAKSAGREPARAT